MLNFAGLVAAVLAAWHLWDREWFLGALWVLAAAALLLVGMWWRSALRAWRDPR
jgi:hypothetical protein